MKFIASRAFPVLAGACLVLACQSALAVHKCTDAKGQVVYQDARCPDGKGQELVVKPSSAGFDGGDGGYAGGGYGGYGGAGSYGGYSSGTVHTGPRGGRYTITPSGNKNYLPRR